MDPAGIEKDRQRLIYSGEEETFLCLRLSEGDLNALVGGGGYPGKVLKDDDPLSNYKIQVRLPSSTPFLTTY